MLQNNQAISRHVLQAMPKIDLHRHLEGSLRLQTLFEVAQNNDIDVAASTIEELRPQVQITNDPQTSDAFLSKFHVLRLFYCSPQIIKRLVYEAVTDAAEDNVHYLELRFSPQALSRVYGFPLTAVTDWVIEAANEAAQAHKIKVGLIITLVRHDPIEQAAQVARVAIDRKDRGIVGLDLAGDEVRYPPEPFIPFFKEAKQEGMGVTIHAGEWASAYGVAQALDKLCADRIGHGIRALENSKVLKMVLERKPVFEVCLTSNLQTGVVMKMEHHPFSDMLDVGLPATLNTDDPTVSNCTLTDEFEIAVNSLGLDYASLRKMTLTSAQAAFLPDAKRLQLVNYFRTVLPEKLPETFTETPIPSTLV